MSATPQIIRKFGLSKTKEIPRKVIFSGIQPTGVPHLGNYLGALRQGVKLQNEAEKDTKLIYCLVDLHAITVKQDPNDMKRWMRESLAILLAIGLDPKRSLIYRQSDVLQPTKSPQFITKSV
jgi:tryptophanyl-tRNA synthetase